jgi:hypothetical protein
MKHSYKWEGKTAKLSLCTPRRHIRWVDAQPHLFLTSALDGGEWLDSRLECITRGRLGLDIFERKKTSCPMLG